MNVSHTIFCMKHEPSFIAVRKIVARNVRCLRESAGYSQETLATMACMNRGHLSELETCKGNPSIDKLVAISDCLDVPITRLFDGADERPPYQLK